MAKLQKLSEARANAVKNIGTSLRKFLEFRANAVKNILVKTYKISAKRLQAKGMGATDKLFKQVEFNRVATFNDNNAAE